jgi:SHS2 domain-containing protein
MTKFEIIEHTADVGIKATGNSLNETFENAAFGMFNIIVDVDGIKETGEYNIVNGAFDLEELLVNFLSELLFIQQVQDVLLSRFDVKIEEKEGGYELNAKAFGEKFDEKRHKYNTEIKAVTRHILEVKNSKPYHAQVLFDI